VIKEKIHPLRQTMPFKYEGGQKGLKVSAGRMKDNAPETIENDVK
jgi:hypothetical protein